ncbi:hypothetical protein Salat_0159200 [Sesamum alatum]|uniref:Uncharacterized protein n=1 Tax=Sesamum alatum TaxID=300844 RepID=A0AAE1YX63_9LAMI|nr:hypothetical protein Salat_0159200 [Sesamum alatum]
MERSRGARPSGASLRQCLSLETALALGVPPHQREAAARLGQCLNLERLRGGLRPLAAKRQSKSRQCLDREMHEAATQVKRCLNLGRPREVAALERLLHLAQAGGYAPSPVQGSNVV